jgi:hypothetical protein
MKVAVIVVSFNTRDLLRNCLHSVYTSAAAGPEPLDVTVVVVDNASRDGSAAMAAAEFSQTRLIAAERNLGFTGANNLALKNLGFGREPLGRELRLEDHASLPDFVLLLNADAELIGDALYTMATFLRDAPSAGVCGARLQYGDGRFQHGAFRFPTLFQIALDFFPLTGAPGAHRLHNSLLNGRYPARLWQGQRPFPVDFVLGAAMMVRGAAIEQVGGLDDGYFMYCEEVDWCLRLAEASWPAYALPSARVIHHEGQSSRQTRWTAYEQLWRSRFRFYAKHRRRYPAGYLTVLRALVRVGLKACAWQARRRFAQGEITGVALAEELAAYAQVAQL